MKKTLRIFALGGNEVSPTGIVDPINGKLMIPDIAAQWQRTYETTELLSDIIETFPKDYFVLTHGNGPQVGNILLRAEYARPILHPLPLDICGADSQGAMAYMLSQLSNSLKVRGIKKCVSGIVTQVVVNKDDPDFNNPTKFIGPPFTKEEALEKKNADGWAVKLYKKNEEGHEIWRRVVPSPMPIDIVEFDAIESSLKAGHIPITVGGGGIPVIKIKPTKHKNEETYKCNFGVVFTSKPNDTPLDIYTGIEAVIDKDLASSLLGIMLIERFAKQNETLDATLAIITSEDGAKLNYQKPDQKDLRVLSAKEAMTLYKTGAFPAGSMGPKVLSCIKFIEGGGRAAYITKAALYKETLEGKAGTTIVP